MPVLEICGRTERGLVRSANEDHVLIGRWIKNRGDIDWQIKADDDFLASRGLLLAVSDGIGGEKGGRTASEMALVTLDRHFYSTVKEACPEDFLYLLGEAAERANADLLDAGERVPELSRMGCTLSGVCLMPKGYLVFNAGDSRVYRVRNQTLKRLTEDHTLARLLRRGAPDEAGSAEQSADSHTLVNFLGKRDFHLEIEHGPELWVGDVLLVCSDGLHGYVKEDVIEAVLAEGDSQVSAITAKLVACAMEEGGGDNISLIVLRLSDRAPPASAAEAIVTPSPPASSEATQ